MKKKNKLLVYCLALFSVFTTAQAQNDAETDAQRRQFLNVFIDAYQQAYEKENTGFLNLIFGEDALILTQTMELKRAEDKIYFGKGKKYRIIAENKKKYLDRLSKIFLHNENIRLNLSGAKITRHRIYGSLYGVTLHQYLQYSGTGDGLYRNEGDTEGYLFLMVDFSLSETMPTIHIRTWQPEKVAEHEGVFSIYSQDVVRK